MKFNKTEIDLGEVKVGSSCSTVFRGTPEDDKIEKVSVSCGCIKASHTDTDVTVSFKIGTIPYHLKRQGYYNGMKKVTAYIKDKLPIVLVVKYKAV